MKAVLQRVRRGVVSIDGEAVGSTGPGLVVLVGVAAGDVDADAGWLAAKTAALRIFEDGEGRMNRSAVDAGGSALVISQFTLLADTSKGRRPSFVGAAPPEDGKRLYLLYAELLRDAGLTVETGRFGERMLVEIENDGPVTIILDSRERPGGTT